MFLTLVDGGPACWGEAWASVVFAAEGLSGVGE